MTDTPAPTTPRTLAELDRLAAELHARVITSEGMETMMRLAYERGLAEARATPAEALDRVLLFSDGTERHWLAELRVAGLSPHNEEVGE